MVLHGGASGRFACYRRHWKRRHSGLGQANGQFVNGLRPSRRVVGRAMSLEIIDWSSIVPMLEELWPLLVMMVGFFILAVRCAIHCANCSRLAYGRILRCRPRLVRRTGVDRFVTLALPFKEAPTIDVNPGVKAAMSVNKFSQYPKSANKAIIVGVGCVLFGVWSCSAAFGCWWNAIQRGLGTLFSICGPSRSSARDSTWSGPQ